MDAHELYTIQRVKAAFEEGKSDGREHVRQQTEVDADLKAQRAAMKRGRR